MKVTANSRNRNRNRVINCSALDLLSQLSDSSVGSIMTDPPEKIDRIRQVVKEINRVLRPGGSLVLIGGSTALHHWERIVEKAKLYKMAEVIILWDSGRPRNMNFGSVHSRVLWYTKGGYRHTFNVDPKVGMFSNVLVCKRVPVMERVHPSEKPVGLTNFLISLLTNEDEIVVDPYCGSGSTLVSAVQCGRGYIGSDTDGWYVKVARKRANMAEMEVPERVSLWVNGTQYEV